MEAKRERGDTGVSSSEMMAEGLADQMMDAGCWLLAARMPFGPKLGWRSSKQAHGDEVAVGPCPRRVRFTSDSTWGGRDGQDLSRPQNGTA